MDLKKYTVLHLDGSSHPIFTNLSLNEMFWVIRDIMKANEKYNIIQGVR